ncbi:virulence factor Mce [Actinomadura craniellae]|uniref:Virulence factor Mce n=1 Tax=Actinomadura craniellae TaxID=2231787 RepID=A0A365HB27_9ACTN|nr:MCE family protein [Actinomadura craniellae]RAY16239.1 virulence factor Mce [Actinomadura craniellae]
MKRLIVLVIVLAILPVAAGCSFQTLGAPKGDMTLVAVFDDVQNLVDGHSVQLSDVTVGTVTGIRLEGYRARVTMSIADGRRIPAGTGATIAKTSLLGENYIRLDPPRGVDTGRGPFLADGSRITRTSVQPDLERISERVGPVLAALGGQDLGEAVSGLATGLAGQGPRLHTIIERATEISRAYAAASDDLVKVIDGMGRLSRSLAAHGAELDRLPGSVRLATERVRKDRAELKRALADLVALSDTVNGRIQERHGERMRALLLRLDAVLTAMVRGKDQLKAFSDALLTNFAQAPSMTHAGQGLIHVWLGGFLPADRERPPGNTWQDLQRLMKPR